MLLPLSYYTLRQDKYDERFSWRMFSDVRMLKCRASYTRGGDAVTLSQEFHMAWNTLVQRGRSDVLDAVSRELCQNARGKPVQLRLQCREADGTMNSVLDGKTNVCESGQ
jgi:hypothetical protein